MLLKNNAVMKKQILAQIVTVALLAQSCVAYHRTSVPINQAANQGRVQIV